MKVLRRRTSGSSGFTLLELLLAIALGAILMAMATTLYRQAVNATVMITARGEMQQNLRVGANSIAREISIAGTGIPNGGIVLPNTTGTNAPRFGCYTGTCIPNSELSANAFPGARLYPVIPSYQRGITSLNQQMSAITLAYADPLQPPDIDNTKTTTMADYNLAAFNTSGSQITINSNVNVTDNYRGLRVGDVLLISNVNGTALGVITGLPGSRVVQFANPDPLNLNQPSPATGNLASILAGGTAASLPTTAVRLNIVTYYLSPEPGPDNTVGTSDDGPPKLMRQVNAQKPIPVAEGIEILRFTYDVYDDSAASPSENAAQNDPSLLSQIRTVNLQIGARSVTSMASGNYQRLSFYTSVSPRNLSFRDRYK